MNKFLQLLDKNRHENTSLMSHKRIQKVEIRSVEFYIKKDYEMMINNVMFINHSK